MPFAKGRKPPELSEDEVQELETIRRSQTEERRHYRRRPLLLVAMAWIYRSYGFQFLIESPLPEQVISEPP
jgi:hypothetical protein